MKIRDIRLTPLHCPFKQPYHWSQGVTYGAPVVLIEIETDAGVTGIGECSASPTHAPILAILEDARPRFIGQSVFDVNRLIWAYYQYGFNAKGIGRAPRYFSQAMTGIELAAWDAIGKQVKLPLHQLLGGKVRESVEYFGFVQGDTPGELAAHAADLVRQGFKVLYVKVGRGNDIDIAIAREIRKAVGPKVRLRLDANEAWDMLNARRMFEALKPFDPEFIEQPVSAATGPEGLARLRAVTDIPIAADQTVYSAEDVYDIVRCRSADVIVLGMHETCGVIRFRKAAAVAEAAGVNICIHGIFETGITTSATNQVAATIGNMDDGNQIMWQLLKEDIVSKPNLTPKDGALPVSELPGLGFELNPDAVARAAEEYRKL
jgi:muconate cycloisomerase